MQSQLIETTTGLEVEVRWSKVETHSSGNKNLVDMEVYYGKSCITSLCTKKELEYLEQEVFDKM